MIWVLELATPVLALEAGLRLDGLEHLLEDLAGGRGGIFDGRVGFEGQHRDLSGWDGHLGSKPANDPLIA